MDWTEQLAQGMEHHRAGRLATAMAVYREVLARQPRQADTLNLLGLALHQSGQHQLGAQHIAQAIQLSPDTAAYYANLGMAARALGQLKVAQEAYAKALSLDTRLPDAWFNQGNLQKDLGQLNEAAASYERSLQLCAEAPDAWNNLGVVRQDQHRWADAEHCYRRALALEPHNAGAHSNLGLVLEKQFRFAEALHHTERAVALQPGKAEFHVNRASIWHSQGQVERGVAAYREALRLDPGHVIAHLNLGMLLLLSGQFAEGWREYEWRLKSPDSGPPRRALDRPRWDGCELRGRTLLLRAEQGLGDTLQFIRYAPLLAAQGARVALECQAPLLRLLRGMPGLSEVMPHGAPLPAYDYHLPLLSAPGALGCTAENIPAPFPYVPVPTDAGTALPRDGRLRVGLCWSGNVFNKFNYNRLIQLASLRPILEQAGCAFYSFQIGPAAQELTTLPPALRPQDLAPMIRDLADTAALAAQMDLILTVDTCLAHLAGAMNLRVWTLLAHCPDWRWQLHGTVCPWYPSMRLFRQNQPGDWSNVIAEASAQLAALAAERR